jgi:hypothetical protein
LTHHSIYTADLNSLSDMEAYSLLKLSTIAVIWLRNVPQGTCVKSFDASLWTRRRWCYL